MAAEHAQIAEPALESRKDPGAAGHDGGAATGNKTSEAITGKQRERLKETDSMVGGADSQRSRHGEQTGKQKDSIQGGGARTAS